PGGRAGSQIPVKSGLPSGVLGAGAVKSGLLSFVLGTPRVGYAGHCANRDTVKAAKTIANCTTLSRVLRLVITARPCAPLHPASLQLVHPPVLLPFRNCLRGTRTRKAGPGSSS